MKLISYSLFGINNFNENNLFEFRSYVRGFYFNCRMNNLIYPDFRTHLEVSNDVYIKYQNLFDWLVNNNNLSLSVVNQNDPLCKAMLWRMKPIFYQHITYVFCRDTDAITTYREAKAVQCFIESTNYSFHALLDNKAHSGLMGGMVGFKTNELKAICNWKTWDEMVNSFKTDYNNRGSDQFFLNSVILPKIKDKLLFHNLTDKDFVYTLPMVDKKLWESNLVCRHIGSAGVIDMEVLRFFNRFDEYNWKYNDIEKQYPEIFYWHLK